MFGFVAENRLQYMFYHQLCFSALEFINFICILYSYVILKFRWRKEVDEIVNKINKSQATKFNDKAEMPKDIQKRSPFRFVFKVRSFICFK